MRKAIIIASAVEVLCPKCKEPKSQPDSGSLMWEVGELRNGMLLKCYTCQTEFTLIVPKRLQS